MFKYKCETCGNMSENLLQHQQHKCATKECVCGKFRKDDKDVACFICGKGV